MFLAFAYFCIHVSTGMYEKVRMEMSERVNSMMELDNVSHINLIL